MIRPVIRPWKVGVGALGAVSLLVLAGCGKPKEDRSPTGVVKRFLAASFKAETAERHKALYELLGPRTRARLKASADRATAATGGKRTYAPYEMLSASFRPSAKGDWTPKKFKLLSSGETTARVEVRGEKKGERQVVSLVKVKGRWRIELDPAPAKVRTDKPAPAPAPGPKT